MTLVPSSVRTIIEAQFAHPLGTQLTSYYDSKITGPVVGYGMIQWPTEAAPRVVYLVQVAHSSSSLKPACAVLSEIEKDV